MRLDGCIDLVDSKFQDNFAANSTDDDGVGIVNYAGQVRCDATSCLPVCTECGDHPVPSSGPSQSPTPRPTVSLHPTVSAQPTPRPKVTARAEAKGGVWLMAGFALGCLALWTGVTAVVCRCRGRRRCGVGLDACSADGATNAAEGPFDERLAGIDPGALLGRRATGGAPPLDSVELVGSSVMKSYELSLAPVFVIGSRSMRITIWSPGMHAAAPILAEPVGMLLSDLPFVNSRDGYKLHRSLARIFDAPAEHDPAKTFMVFLLTKDGRVLLEMRTDHLVTECEPIIVVAGRQVNADLACMMACESTVAPSESNGGNSTGESTGDLAADGAHTASGVGDQLRSVSDVGSVKGQ